MSIRLVFSQAEPQKRVGRDRFPTDVCSAIECALRQLIAEDAIRKTQIILAIEEALTELGPAVEIGAERRMIAMINALAAAAEPARDS